MGYLVFLVSLSEGGLEASVSVHEAGDLLDGVHDEHVHQVLPGAIQPSNGNISYSLTLFCTLATHLLFRYKCTV